MAPCVYSKAFHVGFVVDKLQIWADSYEITSVFSASYQSIYTLNSSVISGCHFGTIWAHRTKGPSLTPLVECN